MPPTARTTTPVRHTLLAASLAAILCAASPGASAQAPAEAAPAALTTPSLKDLFEAAWSRQPEAQALQRRHDAMRAQRRAAEAWTPDPPAFEASHETDRLTRNGGARALEIGMTVPLWLPGERAASAALADAEAAALQSRVDAARMRLAASLREAWWNWLSTGVDAETARGQLDSARRIAADVARRTRAGDLARADQHQADGAVASAEAAAAQAETALSVALQQIKALSGTTPNVRPAVDAATEREPMTAQATAHPALAEWQDRFTVAERAVALARTQSRANPELTLTTTRDRDAAGERYGQTVTLAVRIPFGGGPRHDSRVASAQADALEAQAQLELDRLRLQSESTAAQARVDAARLQRAAAERRAALGRETRGFFEKSFRLGETDLPTRLRIEAEATEAERQAARSHIELAAAISAWRQVLGLLP